MVWVAIHYEMDDRTLHKLKQSLQTMILQIEGSVCNMNPGKLNKRITIKKPSPNPMVLEDMTMV
ncbi:hypothetical protein P7H17_00020 [Paenibacillus larvae]|nr:hypothetical protein [Paenibacillus larvae]MDT2284830.1 hypothetical protein [Paenibacillus larvae]